MNEGELSRVQKAPTTSKERFSGFALGHITYSALSIFFGSIFLIHPIASMEQFWLLTPLLLMGGYFPLGAWMAWLEEWTPPQTGTEKMRAVMQPTMVAWGWVIVVAVSIYTKGEGLAFLVFPVSILFAAPSSVFSVIFCALSNGSIEGLLIGGIISGFLPPFLFALGSFRQGRKNQLRILAKEEK